MEHSLTYAKNRLFGNGRDATIVSRQQKFFVIILQLLLALPYFQSAGTILFLCCFLGGILLLFLSRYLKPLHRKIAASVYSIAGAAGLLFLFGWQDISAIAMFFFIVGFAKLAEIHSYRDISFQVILIVVQTVFVLFLSPVFTTFVVSGLEMLGIVLITQNTSQFSLVYWKRSIGLLASAIPMAIVFFLFVPRFNANIFDLGMMMGMPGAFQLSQGQPMPLNDSVGFDDLAAKSQSDTRVLIANFHEGVDPFFDGIPPLERLYWRGPVLWSYENNQWLPRKGWDKKAARMRGRLSEEAIYNMIERTDKLSAYSVALFPSYSYWTYALDIPSRSAASTYVTKDLQLLNLNPIRNVLKYHISSYLGYKMKNDLSDADRGLALQINDGIDPLLREYAHGMRKGVTDNTEFVNKVLLSFSDGYSYDPAHKSTGKKHAMDAFLFDEKIGNSAHFASAFALIMRHAGIPTRLVAGYRGGNVVGLTEMVLILENDAYVWAESWINGQGWVRIDPAMPVAGPPGTGGGGWGLGKKSTSNSNKDDAKADVIRNNIGRPETFDNAEKFQKGSMPNGVISERDTDWFETFQSDWVRWINNFNSESQTESFLENSENASNKNWFDLLAMLGAGAFLVLSTATAVLYLVLILKRKRKSEDFIHLEYRKFVNALKKRGVAVPQIENIGDMIECVAFGSDFNLPGARKYAVEFVECYASLRYRGERRQSIKQDAKRLRLIRKKFESYL